MNFNTKTKLLLALSILLAASLACSFLPSSGEDGTDADAGEAAEAADGGADEGGGETVEDGASGNGGQVAAGECIVGTWAVDLGSMQTYLNAAMNESEDVFVVGDVSGEMLFTFSADGIMSLSSQDFIVKMTLDTGVEGFALELTFVMVAEGSAHYTADGTTLTNTEQDYTSEEGTLGDMADFSGGDGTIEITINPSLFISSSTEGAATTYECSGDTLTFTGEEFAAVVFRRVE